MFTPDPRRSPAAPVCCYRVPRAFSLIELLVVVAIIAILAAIAIPVVGSALDSGAKAKDVNNLRSIAACVLLFTSENDNRLPGPVNRSTRDELAPQSTDYLAGLLDSLGYIPKGSDVWKSPANYVTNHVYVLNNCAQSDPPEFFGDVSAQSDPKKLAVLRANIAGDSAATNSASLAGLWMLANADGENYGPSSQGAAGAHGAEVRTPWGGRHYAFFDGTVQLVRRTAPSSYPSSSQGNYD